MEVSQAPWVHSYKLLHIVGDEGGGHELVSCTYWNTCKCPHIKLKFPWKKNWFYRCICIGFQNYWSHSSLVDNEEQTKREKKRGRRKSAAADTADLLSIFLKDCCCSREQLHPCSICGLAPVFFTSKTYCTVHPWSCSNSLHPASTHTDISIRCTN